MSIRWAMCLLAAPWAAAVAELVILLINRNPTLSPPPYALLAGAAALAVLSTWLATLLLPIRPHTGKFRGLPAALLSGLIFAVLAPVSYGLIAVGPQPGLSQYLATVAFSLLFGLPIALPIAVPAAATGVLFLNALSKLARARLSTGGGERC
jgi:hypothetical protein